MSPAGDNLSFACSTKGLRLPNTREHTSTLAYGGLEALMPGGVHISPHGLSSPASTAPKTLARRLHR